MTGIEGELATYYHSQKGPWWLLLYILTAVFATAAWFSPVPALQITFLVTGLFMFLLGLSFHHLTVAAEGGQLAIYFGPLPLFRKRIWYDDIIDAEKGRTTFLDGWGIHWSPWGGWVWRLKRGKLKIGTDDADGLAGFLKTRIAVKG
jgi:hypothetical protein